MADEISSFQLAIQGNIAAFINLETKCRFKIYRALYFMSLDENEILEIVHKTFLLSYRSLSQLENPVGFLQLSLKIALRLAIDFIKNRGLFQKHKSSKEQISPNIDEKLATKLPLRQVIASLPFEQKSVLVLRDMEGYSYRQISKILDCNVKIIAKRLSDARNILSQRIGNLDAAQF